MLQIMKINQHLPKTTVYIVNILTVPLPDRTKPSPLVTVCVKIIRLHAGNRPENMVYGPPLLFYWIYAINNINTDGVACVPCCGHGSRAFAGPYPASQQSILSVV